MSDPAEVGWKRLHPASVLVNLVPRVWQLLRMIWPFALAWIAGNRMQGGVAFVLDLPIVALILGIASVRTVLHWATLRYRFTEGRLEVQTGLLSRQTRVIAPERVQNVETIQNFFQRLAGLVEVRIETASGTEVEGLLSALSVADADEVVKALGRRSSTRAERAPTERPLLQHEPIDLLWYGVTAFRPGAAAVAMGVAYQIAIWSTDNFQRPLPGGIGTAASLALLAALAVSSTWTLGVIRPFMQLWGYGITDDGQGLRASSGMFTRRSMEVHRAKIQLVAIEQPWLRRQVGFGSVRIETAAARENEGGTSRAELQVPVVWDDELPELLARTLPVGELDLASLPWRSPHPRAIRRELVRSLVSPLLLACLLWIWLGSWGLLALLLAPLSLFAAWLDVSHQGWLVTERLILVRQGYMRRTITLLDRTKLQSTRLSAGPFLRRLGLAQLQARVAGSDVVLPILAYTEAASLQHTLRLTQPAPAGGQ